MEISRETAHSIVTASADQQKPLKQQQQQQQQSPELTTMIITESTESSEFLVAASTTSVHQVFMEKCFKRVIEHLDFIDRLVLLECVNNAWRRAVYYDDIRTFRLSDLSSWSAEDALSGWTYDDDDDQQQMNSSAEEWSTLEGNDLHRVLNSILTRCTNLVSLTFGGCPGSTSKIVINTETVRMLKTLSPQLQCLDVSGCGVTDEALLKLMKKYKRTLTELNLNHCILIPTGILTVPQLERSLDDSLRKMRKLRRLNPSVYDCDVVRLPETGLQCFVGLELTNKSVLADQQLARLWCESGHNSVYNLESLVLSDNNAVRRFDIISHLQSLRRLVLRRLPRLSDDDLQQIFHWCQKLVDVELTDCRRVRLRFRWPSALRRVRILDPAVFDGQNLVAIGAQCASNLRVFEVRMKNLHTTGPDANAYALFAKLCPRLRRVQIDMISLPACTLFQFIVHCRRLASISCKQLMPEDSSFPSAGIAPAPASGVFRVSGIPTGVSGVSGIHSVSGISGFPGGSRTSGFSGAFVAYGVSGVQGPYGVSGLQGPYGVSGVPGISGVSGVPEVSRVFGGASSSSATELGAVSGGSGGKRLRLKSLFLYNTQIDFHLFMELIDRCGDRLSNLQLNRVSFNCESRDDSFCAVLSTLASRCLKLRSLTLVDCCDASAKSIRAFYEARRRQFAAAISAAVRIKRTKFYYRNIAEKLVPEEDEAFQDEAAVGVDFVQERGVSYNNTTRTTNRIPRYEFADSFHEVAFC